MKELRRQSREIINFYLQIKDRNTDELLGYLLDVNDGGLLMQTHEELNDVGALYPIRLMLRDSLEGHETLDLDARLIWSRKQPGSVFNHSGFELVKVDEASQKVIHALVQRFGLDVSETG
jgi:hypothetical protein